MKKAFLQIRINEEHRDAQTMLWYKNLKKRKIVEYRFTRVIFGAAPSPYILGTTLQQHVRQFQDEYSETTKALLEDLLGRHTKGGESISKLETFKEQGRTIVEKR